MDAAFFFFHTNRDLKEAHNALLTAVFGFIYGKAMKYAKNPDIADEIVQRTAEKILRGIHGFKGSTPGKFRGWCTTIIRNEFLQILRSSNLWYSRVNDDADLSIIPTMGGSTNPEEMAEVRLLFDRLNQAEIAIPPMYRAVIPLILEGMSLKEMREILDYPSIPAIKSVVHRARKMLRKQAALIEENQLERAA